MRPRTHRDAWMKYHATPQRYPHKDLMDLGDNWISSLAGRKGRKEGMGEPFADNFTPFANNGTRTPAIFRPFLRSRQSPRTSRDLRGPSWRVGGAYNRRSLPPVMRQIARGNLMGPRSNSRSWGDARSHRSVGRGRSARGSSDREGQNYSGRARRSRRASGDTALGNPFDSKFVPRFSFSALGNVDHSEI